MKERFRMHPTLSRELKAVKSVTVSPDRRYCGGD